MNRVDLVQNDGIAERIARLRKSTDARKSPQRMGFDVTTLKANATEEPFDIVVPKNGGNAFFTVKFTADSQENASGSTRFDLLKQGLETHASPNTFTIQTNNLGSVVASNVIYTNHSIYNSDPDNDIYIKAFVFATDTGTVEVEAL